MNLHYVEKHSLSPNSLHSSHWYHSTSEQRHYAPYGRNYEQLAMHSGSRSLTYIDWMSEPESRPPFALSLIHRQRQAVSAARRGGRPARLVGVGDACRRRGFLWMSVLVEAKS